MVQQAKPNYPIESIPPEDSVSSCCFAIDGIRPLDPATDFKFTPADHKTVPLATSVVWRKYAVNRYDVDQRGEIIADERNARNRKNKRLGTLTYVGFRTAMVRAIHSIRTERGFRFAVTHAPSLTFRAHARITIEHANHPDGPAFMINDRVDLMSQLIDRMPMDVVLPNEEAV